MPAILCPRCRKLISSDVSRCPYCGQVQPGMWGLADALRKLGLRVDFTWLILRLCVGLYVLGLLISVALDGLGALFPSGGGFSPLGFLAPTFSSSELLGMTGAYPVLLDGRWWTLLTAVYLHGSLLHIFFNMMWVRQLAPLVEDLFGPYRLFVIYTVAGVTGFVFSSAMGVIAGLTGFSVPLFGAATHSLGASGSIFGLLAAAIVYGRQQRSTLFTRQFLQWAVLLFVFGLIYPRVDNWAHAGGFVGGYGMAYLFSRERSHEGPGTYIAAGLCVALTVVAFMLQIGAALTMW